MKVYRDLDYVRKRKRIAALSSIGGIALLGSAFWLASAAGQSGVFIAYVPLLAGTVLFHLGMQQVGKWNRPQRNDVVLDSLLKDLGDRYALIHYAKVGKRTVEHSLVYPGGILAITTRELPGQVAYQNGRWRKIGQGLTRFFGMGGAFLGNPTSDAAADVQALNQRLADETLEADVDAVVSFINPEVKLDVTEPEYPVTNGDGLRPYIAALPSDSSLQSGERQRLVEILTRDGNFEVPVSTPTRRPVKRKAA
jgi:hypothetical protein